MTAEIRQLRSGTDAIEEQAREQLGMIKRGETFYLIDPAGSCSMAGASLQPAMTPGLCGSGVQAAGAASSGGRGQPPE